MRDIAFPDMRRRVFDGLEVLADVAYQRRFWVEGRYEPGELWDDLTSAVNALDDVRALDHPEQEIGTIFRSTEEAEALSRLAGLLVPLIEQLGESPDAVYTDLPQWPAIVDAAAAALHILSE